MSSTITSVCADIPAIHENIPIMLITWDVQEQKYTLNRYCETVLGWTAQDASRGGLMSFLVPGNSPGKDAISYAQTIGPAWRQWTVSAKNGTTIPTLGSASVVRDSTGSAIQCIWSFLNMDDCRMAMNSLHKSDESRNTEEPNQAVKPNSKERQLCDMHARFTNGHIAQLAAATREIESFTYAVSHDLRAPLRGIHGFINILLADHAEKLDEEGRRLCSIIHENSLKMGDLIEYLLEFAQLSQKELFCMSLDMKDMVNSICYAMTVEIPDDKLSIHVEDICNVPADPFMIRQVWTNLVSNAIKFCSKKEKAVITISSETVGDKCIYCIRDNGIGFDMAYLDKLFVIFQRLHSPMEYEGAGIGLAVVRRIIHRHGGEVWAEGEENKGAAFYFSLPLHSSI
jgi:signal transduction histidine kinase